MEVVTDSMAVVGVGLLLAGLIATTIFRLFALVGRKQGASGVVRDSETLRAVLGAWESLVVREGGTFRDVKRFANRSRFFVDLHGGREGGMSDRALVGFVALEECGALDAEAEGFDFDKWRNARSGEGFLPAEWAESVGAKEWEMYKALLRGEHGLDGGERTTQVEGGTGA